MADKKNRPCIYMVGTTHFDPVWMWRWDEGMASIRSTFRSALERMKETPEFIYSFSSPAVFKWIKKVDPGMFEEIKERVEEGRWELVHGWWVQPDCFAASGESYVRQGLYGQMFLKENFGEMARCGFNTDSFGHNLMMPQIMKKSGIDYYVFGRPSPADQTLPEELFAWKSPDGSRVTAFRCGSEGANAYSQDVKNDLLQLGRELAGGAKDTAMLYGVSNHGGAPTKKAIADIKSVIASEKEQPFRGCFARAEEFFDGQRQADIPEVSRELTVRDFGVFSNHTEIKKNNRIAEYTLLNAEKVAVLADTIAGKHYPGGKIKSLWQDVLLNQFHDILGGASVRPAYFDARNLHGRAIQSADEILHYSLQAISKDIDTSGEGFPIIVWNPNTFPVRAPVEVEMQWAWEFGWYEGPLRLLDREGRDLPVQVIQENSVLPGFRSRIVFCDDIPPLGYRVYHLRRESGPEIKGDLKASESVLENSRYRVSINPRYGSIDSVYDKQKDRQILGRGASFLVRRDDGDTWAFDVSEYGEVLGRMEAESVRVIEDGPVRAVVRTKGRYKDSVFEQDIILYSGSDAVEGRFKVDWREKHSVLKLEFDSLLEDAAVTSSTPYGSVERKGEGCELPTGEWLNLSSTERGVSIISDSVFACDVNGSVAGLTLLRSPVYGHLARDGELDREKDYEHLGQGRHDGSWKLVFHDGDWSKKAVPQQAMAFNNPVITIDEGSHPGTLPPEKSFMDVEAASSIVTVLKGSEDGEALIVRMYEYAGQDDTVNLDLPIAGGTYETTCSCREIKTLRLEWDGTWRAVEVDNLEGLTNTDFKC